MFLSFPGAPYPFMAWARSIHLEFLHFWTLSIIRNSKYYKLLHLLSLSWCQVLISRYSMTRLVQWLRLDLSKGPNRVGVFLLSSEDGRRSSVRSFVFSGIYNSGRWKKSRNAAILGVNQVDGVIYDSCQYPRVVHHRSLFLSGLLTKLLCLSCSMSRQAHLRFLILTQINIIVILFCPSYVFAWTPNFQIFWNHDFMSVK
jgi:hypothetical protein